MITGRHRLAILGTGSDVGKSVLTSAFCRIFSDRGVRVAPFKAQNMSNNAAVTWDGGEIGRAQYVQAQAARLLPTTDMNPVLIKPTTDTGAQVILHGRVLGDTTAKAWFSNTSRARAEAAAALRRLLAAHEGVVIEGAGSCAEVNLRDRDYVNFDMAHAADAPVLLVADIHRGGVFAQVVGTMQCARPADRARVAGVLINRFRGDLRLFEDGVRWLEQASGLPVLGVIPHLPQLHIEEEDALPLEVPLDPPPRAPDGRIRIGMIRLPHVANFTDFLPFARHPASIDAHWLARPRPLAGYDLLILPGTKNTRGDLAWLRAAGWEPEIRRFHAAGGRILGVCGGYQMLGRTVADPSGVEGPPGADHGISPGLSLLPVDTVMAGTKQVAQVRGRLRTGEPVSGYEIHMGRTTVDAGTAPLWCSADGTPDGAQAGQVAGCYLHGLFDEAAAMAALIGATGAHRDAILSAPGAGAAREAAFDRLAAHVLAHLREGWEEIVGC